MEACANSDSGFIGNAERSASSLLEYLVEMLNNVPGASSAFRTLLSVADRRRASGESIKKLRSKFDRDF